MVGADDVDHPLREAAPHAVAMLRPAHRRVHLQLGSEPRVIVGAQGQMMRRRLAAGDVLGLLQQRDLLAGRDVQHMHLRARFAGEADQPLG